MSASGSSGSPLVLHVLEALEGGTARHVADVTRVVRGVRHVVAVPERRVGGLTDTLAAARMRAAGAEVVTVAMTRSPASGANARALVRLSRLVRVRRPDVVHAHSSIAGVLGRLAATRTRARRVYTPHALAQGRAASAVERALGPLTDTIVAVSESEAEALRARRLVSPERIVVIPNGIDLDPPLPPPVSLRTRLGIDPGVPLVGSVARLIPQKAPLDFVAAAARVAARRPDVAFVLVGGGPLAPAVRRAVASAGIGSAFHLIENVPEVGALLGELDVFVLASRFEGGPYSPLEAMRAGVPVVLTDVVGNRDVVEAGVSGELVAPGQPEQLVAAVERLLASTEHRDRVVTAAHRRLAERFDIRHMAERLGELYGATSV